MSGVATNHLNILRKLVDQYSDSGGKGLIHGFQKDLIQNSVGARVSVNHFTNWEITIELKKIDGKYCIIATDRGTEGLTGTPNNKDQVREKTKPRGEWAGGYIPPENRITRFIHSDFSGGDIGPGSKGQGKGLYHMLSSSENKYTYIFESIQNNNGQKGAYLCGKKFIEGVEIDFDFEFPNENETLNNKKEKFISDFKNWTNNEIEPLDHIGTRIIIIGIDENKRYDENESLTFIEVFRNSFDKNFKDIKCIKSFYNMIQETWWEIIIKKRNVKITLKEGDKSRIVKYDGNLKKIMPSLELQPNMNNHEDKNHKIKVVRNIDIKHRGLKIKKLTLIFFKKEIEGLIQKININRRWMKVGNSMPGYRFESNLNKRFMGYVELEEEIENEIAKSENGIHYGFVNTDKFMQDYFNKALYKEYDKFRVECGLGEQTTSNRNNLFRDEYALLMDKLDFANVSNWAPIKKNENFKIKIKSLEKSSENWSVDYTDKIGPIKLEIINNEEYDLENGKIIVQFRQESNPETIEISNKNIKISQKSSTEILVEKFEISPKLVFRKKVILEFILFDENGKPKANNSRWLWLGIDEPVRENKAKVFVRNITAELPSENTRRVNIGEEIKNIECSINSKVKREIECIFVSKITYNLDGRRTLFDFHKQEFKINCEEEKDILLPDLKIDQRFEMIKERAESEKNREIKLQVSIISNEDYPLLEIQKGEELSNKKDMIFYIEYNPKGKGPFSAEGQITDPNKPKSLFQPEPVGNNYQFIINYGHRCWKELEQYRDKKVLKKQYMRNEISKQSILLCIETNNLNHRFFKKLTNEGNLSYKQAFEATNMDPKDSIKYIDELIDKILS